MNKFFLKENIVDQFEDKKILAKIENLRLSIRGKKKNRLIIDNVSFEIREGEIIGIIGESGSGKTIVTTSLLGLNSNIQKIEEGKIIVNDIDVTYWTEEDWQQSKLRGTFISQVFQNPLSSLNPYKKIKHQLIESIKISDKKDFSKEETIVEIIKLMELVKINNSLEVLEMYPHQLSGGMNQRIVIIAILLTKPKLIIFDEPTTALDPIVQAQIIQIVKEIREKFKTTIIFISHDISLVSSIVDTLMIMYAGKIIEKGLVEEVINYPLHPYTWGLISSIPELSSLENKLYSIQGIVPSDISSIEGDAFAERNEYALEIDFVLKPPKFYASNSHYVCSWLYYDEKIDFEPPQIIKELWTKWKS